MKHHFENKNSCLEIKLWNTIPFDTEHTASYSMTIVLSITSLEKDLFQCTIKVHIVSMCD